MNKDMEKTSEMETSKMGLLAETKSFLEILNPSIVKVFVISGSATFTSGIALAIEWLFHGRSHAGFGWIIYYALFLICLPLLLLIGLRILMAISCSSRGSSQIVDSVTAAKEPCADVSVAEQTEVTERNSCRSLAVVVDADERKKRDEKTPRIKRAVSFPSHGKVRSCRTR